MDKGPGAQRVRRHCGFFQGVADDLAYAVEISIRYDTKRDFGGKDRETRREYRMRFGQDGGPQADTPTQFFYVWQWFWKLSDRRAIGESGAQQPLSCTEIRGWSDLLGLEMRQPEIEMILEMDAAYLQASNSEVQSLRELKRAKDQSKPKAKRFGK